jgi:hypothetical protein
MAGGANDVEDGGDDGVERGLMQMPALPVAYPSVQEAVQRSFGKPVSFLCLLSFCASCGQWSRAVRTDPASAQPSGICRAGTPTTVVRSGTSVTTAAPAPTMTSRPMERP